MSTSAPKKGRFAIPSLAEIKDASKVSNKNEPSLFKSSTRTSSNQPPSSAFSKPSGSQLASLDVVQCDISTATRKPTHHQYSKQPPSLGKYLLKIPRYQFRSLDRCIASPIAYARPWQTSVQVLNP